jgi:pimeloyl-ACP methyl ester carboxylesterase
VNETSPASSPRPEYAVGHGEGEYIAGPSGHTVVYYDHPGTGRSGPRTATRYTLEAYAAAIESIREHLDAPTLALVGISFGGLPALEHVRTRPRRVRRLALSNAAYSAASWQRGDIDKRQP